MSEVKTKSFSEIAHELKLTDIEYDLAFKFWNHACDFKNTKLAQLKEIIEKQNTTINEAKEVISYYGDIRTYHTNMYEMITRDSKCAVIDYEDLERIIPENKSYDKLIGGKRARAFLTKVKGE